MRFFKWIYNIIYVEEVMIWEVVKMMVMVEVRFSLMFDLVILWVWYEVVYDMLRFGK